MKVFFVSANVTVEPYPVYPLGMAVVSSALLAHGHEVEQFDFFASGKSEEALRERVSAYAPDVVCYSLRNIDNVDLFTSHKEWYLDGAKRLIDVIREECDVPVICGGPGFSIMPDAILEHIGGDYGVQGEGEAAVLEVLAALERGETPQRITHMATGLGPDEQYSPAFVPEYVEFYEKESGIINLQTKRGCPFKCSYCTYPLIEGRCFRPRNATAVVDDIERIKETYGANDFFFTDSVFNDAAGHYLNLVEEILKRNVNIRWGSFFTPRSQDLDKIAIMKESGLYAVELGTDASSDATLQGLEKGFTWEDVDKFNAACAGEQVPVAHYVIFGGPGETMETVQEGLANIRELECCVVFAFAGIRILPGTPLHQRAIEEGVIPADQDLLRPKYYISPAVDLDAMNEMIERDFRGDRTRVFPPEEGRSKIAIMKNFGFNGILWDSLISYKKSTR